MLTRNPFWCKMEVATDGDAAASYRGIVLKCLWYWGLCLAGVAAYFWYQLRPYQYRCSSAVW